MTQQDNGGAAERFTDEQVYYMCQEMYRHGWNDRTSNEVGPWESDVEFECMIHIHELFGRMETGSILNAD